MKDYELNKSEERLRFSSQGKSRAEKNEQTALIQKRELISKSLNEKETFKKIILDPERTERVRYNLLEEKKQNEEKREQNKGRGFSR